MNKMEMADDDGAARATTMKSLFSGSHGVDDIIGGAQLAEDWIVIRGRRRFSFSFLFQS